VSDWANRIGVGQRRPRKATAATIALLTLNLGGQVVSYFRQDLQPVKDKLAAIELKLTAYQQELDDHERRIKRLEDGESEMGKPEQPARKHKHSDR
jgi:hypothetical protein